MIGPQTEIEQSPIDDLVRPDVFNNRVSLEERRFRCGL